MTAPAHAPLRWPDVERLIERHNLDGVVAALAPLDVAARHALAGPLREYERAHRVSDADFWTSGRRHGERIQRSQVTAVVAAGVLPPSTLVPVLARIPMGTPWWMRPDPRGNAAPAAVARALVDRRVGWIPDLVDRLVARMAADATVFQVLDAILRETGAPPPDSAPFRVTWFSCLLTYPDPVRAEVARGPGWAAALEDVLTLDGAGTVVTDERRQVRVLEALVADGTIRRSALIDAVVARMQRPEHPRDITGVLLVHEAFAPTQHEVRDRRADYLAVLQSGPSKAASTALALLRAATAKDPDGPAVAVEAARSVLVRPETGLATAQLAWLADVSRRDPDGEHAEQVLDVVTAAFTHPAASVRERATALAARWIDRVPLATCDRVHAAAAALPADLRARLGAPEPAPSAAPAPLWAGPAPRLEPVTSVAETAEELATLLATRPDGAVDAVRLERVLAALVAQAHTDPPALRAALAPVVTGDRPPGLLDLDLSAEPPLGPWPGHGLAAVLDAVMTGTWPRTLRFTDRLRTWWGRGGTAHDVSPLSAVLATRLYGIADGIAREPVPCLLSTPTATDGTLDPDTLATRLDAVTRAGHVPVGDLVHALLRCPPEPLLDLADRVRRLDLPDAAAPELAEWLRAPRPLATVVAVPMEDVADAGRDSWNVCPGRAHVLASTRPLPAPPAVARPWRHVLDAAASASLRDDWRAFPWYPVWPLLLPHHRDVVAAHLVFWTSLATTGSAAAGVTATLPLLGDMHGPGPVGTGTHFALACGLAAPSPADRAAAVDALVALSAREPVAAGALDPDWPGFGDVLGLLLARRAVRVARVAEALRDLGSAGAWPAVWRILQTALPLALVPDPEPERPRHELPTGLHLLLALATESAEAAATHVPLPVPAAVPGLEDLASRPGTGRAVVEARRLARYLQEPDHRNA